MGKRLLLSAEYEKIVFEGLLLPELDMTKYYTNIIKKHISNNPEIFNELKNVLYRMIDWYKSQVRGGIVPTIMQDGTTKYFDRNQTFEADEGELDSTKYTKHDLYQDEIWLLPIISERNVRVKKSFFEKHLKTIENIHEIEKLKAKNYILDRVQTMLENAIKSKDVSVSINTYIIKSDDLIRKIFDACNSAFDCDYLTFRKSIETANFHLLNIKKQNRVQDLTFRLSSIMDAEWYSDVCKIMNWKKSTCSGQGQKVENLSETKQLDKILSRPKK